MSLKSIRSKLLAVFLFVIFFLLLSAAYFLYQVSQSDQEVEKINTFKQSATNVQQAPENPGMISPSSGKTGTDTVTPDNTITGLTNSIRQRNDNLYLGIILFTFISIVILTSGAFWIVRSFLNSLKTPGMILENLVRGDTSASIPPTKDEFANIIKAANQLSENLNRSSNFAKSIGDGEVNFKFVPVSDQDTLGNSLVQMREKLKSIAEEDKKRNWSTAGLAQFADFIRKQEDQKSLAHTLISELVKYTKSNQGSLFHLNGDNEKDPYLELIACYAYERKKYLNKRIDIGTGLVGQCFLEGETVYLTKIPKDYVSISSGLGTGNPTSLLIVPLKLNESIEGVIELASFKKYEPHEIEFVKRVGEIIASAISNSRITEHTKKMLAESQQQSEEMRSQEEEMRQNMEEMQATQEAMERQTNEIKKMQVSLELEKSMFNVLMEFLPDRITYKDTESRIMRINKAKAQRINMTPEEVVGKTDYDFFAREHAEKAMREEKALIDSGKPLVDIEERLVFTNGDTAWVSTSRIPFKNENNKTTGMFIITKDITKLKIAELALKDRDTIIHHLLKDLPVFHYKVNKDRIIYEAWTGSAHEGFPDTSQLLSKPVKEVFPQVSKCIDIENAGNQLCSDTFGNLPFRHYVFADSVIAGSFWIYAVVNKS